MLLLRNTRFIPLTMGYRHKRDKNGHFVKRKAPCTARSDTLVPHVHYHPDRTTTYMADKSSVCLLFAIAAFQNPHIELIDIEAAYLHVKVYHIGLQPVYVRQHPRFGGTYKHACKRGKLIKNLYDKPQAGSMWYNAGIAKL